MSAFMVTARNRGVEFVIHSGSDRQVQALVLLRKDHAVELLTVLKENREGVINLLYPTRGEVHGKEGEVTGTVVVAVASKDGEVVFGSCSADQKKGLIVELAQAVAKLSL